MRSRLAFLAGLPLLASIAAGCGSSSSSGPSTTTLRVTLSTQYQTQPITPSTTATTVPLGQVTPEQTYTVQSGDVPVNVAKRFNVTLEALNAANAATPNYGVFYPGLEIIIPASTAAPTTAGSATPTPAASTPASTPTSNSTASSGTAGGSTSGGCSGGTYTIVEGDYPLKVAEKLGTTVEALNAANAGTSGYSAFYPGLKINVC
jgi:LysM repeat protein